MATTYTSPDRTHSFQVIRDERETYIHIDGIDVVDDVHEWIEYYTSLGYRTV
jgi:hypothetical protein